MTVLTDPCEVRKLLARMRYTGERFDESRHGLTASLIRPVMDMCQARGLSGEDAMTMLAYHALLRNEELTDKLIEVTSLRPSAALVPRAIDEGEGP